jgi:hypothetical protein
VTTANAYFCQSASLAGTAATGAISWSVQEGATAVDLRSDGELYQRSAPLVQHVQTLSVELRDYNCIPNLGAVGSTVLIAGSLTGGSGTGTTRTLTCAHSTIESVEHGTDLHGNALVRVGISIQSSDGLTSGIVWSSP